MGVAAVYRHFPPSVVESVYGKLPLQVRDPAWFWWNALSLAGLGKHWKTFSRRAVERGVAHAGSKLRKRVGKKAFDQLVRRAGKDPRDSKSQYKGGAKGRFLWTKGGRWYRGWGGFTTILVLHRHVTGRVVTKRWQRRLGARGVRVIEKELMNLVNPDAMRPVDALWMAVDYTRRRLAELLHRKHKASMEAAVWILQGPVPFRTGCLLVQDGRVVTFRNKHASAYIRHWRE